MQLNNFTKMDPPTTDTWEVEVEYYDTDCEGRKLWEPVLGVRVNGGTWLKVKTLLKFIRDRKRELRNAAA